MKLDYKYVTIHDRPDLEPDLAVTPMTASRRAPAPRARVRHALLRQATQQNRDDRGNREQQHTCHERHHVPI